MRTIPLTQEGSPPGRVIRRPDRAVRDVASRCVAARSCERSRHVPSPLAARVQGPRGRSRALLGALGVRRRSAATRSGFEALRPAVGSAGRRRRRRPPTCARHRLSDGHARQRRRSRPAFAPPGAIDDAASIVGRVARGRRRGRRGHHAVEAGRRGGRPVAALVPDGLRAVIVPAACRPARSARAIASRCSRRTAAADRTPSSSRPGSRCVRILRDAHGGDRDRRRDDRGRGASRWSSLVDARHGRPASRTRRRSGSSRSRSSDPTPRQERHSVSAVRRMARLGAAASMTRTSHPKGSPS